VGYSASLGFATITNLEQTFLQKELPAGHFVITANAGLFAGANAAMRAGVLCTLYDSPAKCSKLPAHRSTKRSVCRANGPANGLTLELYDAVITAIQTHENR
jgi:hypothetical protein